MHGPRPWISSYPDLERFLGGDASRQAGGVSDQVLVTQPVGGGASALPIGSAIRAALRGRTRSLSMLVGFFSDGNAGQAADDTPLGLIRAEAAEELSLPWHPDSAESVAAGTEDAAEFRLLFGALAGRATGVRLALTSFWWACRWQATSPDAACAWRTGVVEEWRRSRNSGQGSDPGRAFESFAMQVLGRVDGSEHRLPLLAAPERPQGGEETSQGSPATAESGALGAWHRSWREADDSTARAAAVLTLFFILRSGHIRLQATGDASRASSGGLFHGKLYVIERDPGKGDATQGDTIVVMGSPNWSTGALFGSGSHANTEVAAISKVRGWPWGETAGAAAQSESLATRLTWTARALFEDSDETCLLARWGATLAELPGLDEMERLLRQAEQKGRAFVEPESTDAPPPRVAESLDPGLMPLARGLLALIEQALGLLGAGSSARRYVEEHLLRTEGMFAGKHIQGAQADGAVRLLELLHPQQAEAGPGFGGRGAFLTDEAGLGKSVIAQIVAFGLVLEKALDPRRRSDAWPLVTLLAPRQLVVAESGSGPDSGQWQRHRAEILDELDSALRAMKAKSDAPADARRRLDEVLRWAAAERTAPDGPARRIRVLSHSGFQRQLSFDGSASAEAVLRDHAHIAASEVVVVDESHNFRNGGSSRTRLARFLLSLPVPGESWPAYLGDGSDHTLLAGAEAPPACRWCSQPAPHPVKPAADPYFSASRCSLPSSRSLALASSS